MTDVRVRLMAALRADFLTDFVVLAARALFDDGFGLAAFERAADRFTLLARFAAAAAVFFAAVFLREVVTVLATSRCPIESRARPKLP